MSEKSKKVVILDAGSQFGKLIDRRLHEIGIDCDLLPLSSEFKKFSEYGAAIISGSPGSVSEGTRTVDPLIWTQFNKPVLGICYGLQIILFLEKIKIPNLINWKKSYWTKSA